MGRQAIRPRDRAVGGRQDGRQGREGHRELHVENLQPLLLGRQAQDLLLKPLVFLLQRMQRLQHLHDCRETGENAGALRAEGGARGPEAGLGGAGDGGGHQMRPRRLGLEKDSGELRKAGPGEPEV